MNNSERFDSALYGVGERIRTILSALPPQVKSNTEEIRLRRGLPLALTVAGDTVFVRESGQTCFYLSRDLAQISSADLEESFKLLCRGSVYAHSEELKRGFIAMKNGCRAGIGGVIGENGAVKEISSLNIRISKQINGASNGILSRYEKKGLLIAGKPGSGKTTVLRDLIRQISGGALGKIMRVAVIDSRGEISGGGANDLGPAADVVVCSDKAEGMEIAVRTLYPEIVAFDEIGTVSELERVKESFYAGVSVITTAHIGDYGELMSREVTRRLILSGTVAQIALLPEMHGSDIKIINSRELTRIAAV